MNTRGRRAVGVLAAALWAGEASAKEESQALELAIGAERSSTPDFDFGQLSGQSATVHLGYRVRTFGALDNRIPKFEADIVLEGGLLPSGRLDGEPIASPGVKGEYLRLRLASSLRWSVGRIRVGAALIRPSVGFGMSLPVRMFDISQGASWNVASYGDAYGLTAGAKVEAGGWLVDAHGDLMFGPFLGAAMPPGSFGDLGGEDVSGGTDNLKHTGRYTRVEARVERTRGVSPYVTLAYDRYRMKVSDGVPGVSTPFRMGGPSLLVGVALRGKPPERDSGGTSRGGGGASGGSLLTAAAKGDEARVAALLARGAPVDAMLPLEGTALAQAAGGGHLAAVEALLNAGAAVNLAASDNGLTPLMCAAASGHVEVLDRLLAAGATVDQRDTNGQRTALLHACQGGQPAAVDRLLKAGADRSARSIDELTGEAGFDCAAWSERGFGSAEAKAAIAARLEKP